MVDAGSTNFGGSQNDVANQADIEEVDRLAPTASKKTSEEEEDNQASAEAAAFRALRTKVESGGFYLRQEEPSYDTEEHGKVHHQSTYGTQLQQRRVKSDVAPFPERESDTGEQ